MSMNKMFKKVLAVVAAGAMTMGMAMPTFAADEGKTTEAWITKTYNTEVGKAETFSFTATQKTGDGLIGTTANVTMPKISFEASETCNWYHHEHSSIRSDDCTLRCSTDRFCRIQTQKITEIIKYSNQERGCVRRCSAASLFANLREQRAKVCACTRPWRLP